MPRGCGSSCGLCFIEETPQQRGLCTEATCAVILLEAEFQEQWENNARSIHHEL